jgi:sporulation protein YlmC with PRC-barrel domain
LLLFTLPQAAPKRCQTDNNRYSVTAGAVGRPVEIRAYADRIELRQAGRVVGEHPRCFGRDQTVFDPWHYVPVLARKPGALRNGVPSRTGCCHPDWTGSAASSPVPPTAIGCPDASQCLSPGARHDVEPVYWRDALNLRGRSMQRLVSASAAAALAGLLANPALAQQTPAPEPGSPAGEVVQTGTVAVSQLKLVNGLRISKLIGAAIYNEANEKIGTVDDLILTSEDKAVVAIIQVGGFLGAGGKLVAVPYHQLQMDKENKLLMTGANKDSLNAMPGFTYGGSTGNILLPQ